MYGFKNIESEVLEFWKKNRIYEKAKKANKGKKSFYFLDGPPYTSGKVHIGTAWNKSLKDAVLRFKRMTGLDVWDRAGYDMHGLPTAHAVERKLKLKGKEDIPKFGVKKFIEECKKLSLSNLKMMNQDFQKIGVWMDFENPYMTIDPKYIEAEWWLVKKAHETGRLYEGEKTMTWCAECGTALAKHELEYKNVRDDSVFVKFQIVGKKNEFLVIWTTTSWTLPFNLGVMVNPKLDYVKANVDGEIWIMAKQLAPALVRSVAGKELKILEIFKGKKIKGLRYHHPFEDEIKEYEELKKESDKIFSVVLSEEYVDTNAGSGLVHMAPGCGPEDYEVGHREGIPPFNNLNEKGMFPKDFGRFGGLFAKKDDKKIIDHLRDKGCLIAVTQVDHDYAHCWRCKAPVIYKTTTQWFFKIEDLRENMRELNKYILWIPDWAGSRQFDSWLDNLRDNGITRQRYWGTPLPVWRCKNCSDFVVVGSITELKKLSGKIPKDLHIPYIDEITIPCKCGSVKRRIPDILDVWVDAGSASWACLDFPHKKDILKKLWPADFILEGKDQIRGWFNLLFVNSMVGMEKCSFKAVYMHGFVNDADGRKMSKSLGNYILPEEVFEKYGVDTFRFYSIGGANAGVDLNYNFEDLNTRYKSLAILWNVHNFLLEISKFSRINPSRLRPKKLGLEEKYILSRLNSTIATVTELMSFYRVDEAPQLIENLFLDLSRDYIQFIREKSSTGSKADKELVAYTIYTALLGILKLLAPFIPFITEKIYQDMRKELRLKEESIHLTSWPKPNKRLINKDLEENIQHAKEIIQEILSQREKAQLGVRWPLKDAEIRTSNLKVESVKVIIKRQSNIKDIKIRKGKFSVKINKDLTKELETEGFARELTRRVQSLRKKHKMKRSDVIILSIVSSYDVSKWKHEISEKVGAKKVFFEKNKSYKIEDKFKIKGKEFLICFDKI